MPGEECKGDLPDTVVGVCEDAYFFGDLVCHFKSHTWNIICQLIGIFFDDTVQLRAIFLVDLSRKV